MHFCAMMMDFWGCKGVMQARLIFSLIFRLVIFHGICYKIIKLGTRDTPITLLYIMSVDRGGP